MNNFRLYLLQAITRLNALTTRQLETLTASIKDRSNLFRHLKWLLKNEYVTKTYFPAHAAFAYRPTPLALPAVYGEGDKVVREFRQTDILHALLCSEIIINLSYYPNVTGVALEYELDKENLNSLCFSRRPDAIVQLSRGNISYEIAVEVEASLKAGERIDDILNSYEKTFQMGLYCQGLIIAATRDDIYDSYQRRIVIKPQEFQQKVFLTNDLKLLNMKPKIYGERKSHPQLHCNLIRTESQTGVKYISLNSSSYIFSGPSRTHINDYQSGI